MIQAFVLASILSATSAQASWEVKVACGSGAVIDRTIRDIDGTETLVYQLVIRDPSAVGYLSSKLDVNSLVNAQGELIAPMIKRADGYSAQFGNRLLEAKLYSGVLRVAVIELQYYGRLRPEVANWYFNGCVEKR